MKQTFFSFFRISASVAFSAVLLSAALLMIPLKTLAFNGSQLEDFSASPTVPDSELAQLRGGFVSLSGITVDFALNTRAIVDGTPISDVSINSNNLGSITDPGLRQVVQVGQGDASAALNALAQNPSILTFTQVNGNNRVIQQLTTLDLQINGSQSALRTQSLAPQLDFQAVQALR